MKSLTTKLYCDTCKKGIVKLIVSKYKNGDISAKVTNCDRCGKGYGLHGIQSLIKVEE